MLKRLRKFLGLKVTDANDLNELRDFVRTATSQEFFDKNVQNYLRKDVEYLRMIAPYDKAAATALEMKQK